MPKQSQTEWESAVNETALTTFLFSWDYFFQLRTTRNAIAQLISVAGNVESSPSAGRFL